MAALYEKYSGAGLEILGFPCNQFGGQEPGSDAEIQAFAKSRGAKYPILAKVDVNGASQEPLFDFLKKGAGSGGLLGAVLGADIKWNFEKFLIDGSTGQVVKRYGTPQAPMSFESDIVALLNK